ncbi:hypothetical protein GGR57DRAFT_484450 [Xylariaceae sp. FL1272]|nr:hypothetical protein GGR57DRAFT_484450 [Xylariaceae sp. FL1272]
MVTYNTQITQPLFNDSFSLQFEWATFAEACLRPSADFNVDIVCEVQKENIDTFVGLPSLTVEHTTFRNCCLASPPSRGGYEYWTMAEGSDVCERQLCFTTNDTTAEGFDECVVKAATAEFDKLGVHNISTEYPPYRGHCEYIDYDSIKKGIRDRDDVEKSAAMTGHPPLGSWVALVTAVALSVLSSVIL